MSAFSMFFQQGRFFDDILCVHFGSSSSAEITAERNGKGGEGSK